jgi:hypothetical protein
MFLCAALPNKISILRFNTSMNCFVTRKEIDSSEPCSCISFSNTKIIVGSNKFYQIDLRQFTIQGNGDCSGNDNGGIEDSEGDYDPSSNPDGVGLFMFIVSTNVGCFRLFRL